jgi:hypothetical protein
MNAENLDLDTTVWLILPTRDARTASQVRIDDNLLPSRQQYAVSN